MKTSNPEKLTNFPWLNLFKIRWSNLGKEGDWIYASRKESVNNEADAVIIVPIHGDKLVVTKEFRIPLREYEYGFPAGLKDPNENIEECARRELKEETNLDIIDIIKISPAIYSSSGLGDESVAMVFCHCSGEVSGIGRDATEEMSVHLMDIKEVSELCDNHAVKQSCKLWTVLFMFKLLGRFL